MPCANAGPSIGQRRLTDLPVEVFEIIGLLCGPAEIATLRQTSDLLRAVLSEALADVSVPFAVDCDGGCTVVGRFYLGTFTAVLLGVTNALDTQPVGVGKAHVTSKSTRAEVAEKNCAVADDVAHILHMTPGFLLNSAAAQERFKAVIEGRRATLDSFSGGSEGVAASVEDQRCRQLSHDQCPFMLVVNPRNVPWFVDRLGHLLPWDVRTDVTDMSDHSSGCWCNSPDGMAAVVTDYPAEYQCHTASIEVPLSQLRPYVCLLRRVLMRTQFAAMPPRDESWDSARGDERGGEEQDVVVSSIDEAVRIAGRSSFEAALSTGLSNQLFTDDPLVVHRDAILATLGSGAAVHPVAEQLPSGDVLEISTRVLAKDPSAYRSMLAVNGGPLGRPGGVVVVTGGRRGNPIGRRLIRPGDSVVVGHDDSNGRHRRVCVPLALYADYISSTQLPASAPLLYCVDDEFPMTNFGPITEELFDPNPALMGKLEKDFDKSADGHLERWWLLWGPAGTYSSIHEEEDCSCVWVHAWNGRKRWFYQNASREWVSFEQQAGDTVLMSPNTPHFVVNVSSIDTGEVSTLAVAQNFKLRHEAPKS